MNKKEIDIMSLEKEMTAIKSDIVAEEQANASDNYKTLDDELERIKSSIPYPEVERFSTGMDYADIDDISYKKRINSSFWNKTDIVCAYCNNGSLYSGHITCNGINYYIMDTTTLDTKLLNKDNSTVWLINVDDKKYKHIVSKWRYPSEYSDVILSRNIIMQSRNVKNVDIVMDKSSSFIYSNITDGYLRNALIRNKENPKIRSIIQTINKKQNKIRSLPKEDSFIVQGCAGSGKTMVLLHRLRYLIYNKDIFSDDYLFLIPGLKFKKFINNIATEFGINNLNILPYQDYYKTIVGKDMNKEYEESNELILSQEYLYTVYSKDFIKTSYQEILDSFAGQISSIIELCENKFNEIIDSESTYFQKKIGEINQQTFREICQATKEIQPYIQVKILPSLDNIDEFLSELTTTYSDKKAAYEKIASLDYNVEIAEDDKRLVDHPKLISVQKAVNIEKEALKKASVFTLMAHKNKLEQLQQHYDDLKEALKQEISNQDKEQLRLKTLELEYVYKGVTLSQVESIINIVSETVNKRNDELNVYNIKAENFNDYILEKLSKEIEVLNTAIKQSVLLNNDALYNNFIKNLEPSFDFIQAFSTLAVKLLRCFEPHFSSEKEINAIKDKYKLLFIKNTSTKKVSFLERSTAQLQAHLNTTLLNSLKRRINEMFNTELNVKYKHYWYLSAYCQYLTKKATEKVYPYIFIDEAQDLSVSELELIYKLNTVHSEEQSRVPVMNIFGDVNQTIAKHSINEWSDFKLVSEIYTLNENFRNTNQIVEYCNSNLFMSMEKVGVDMNKVSLFKSIKEAMLCTKTILNSPTFIVKDERAAADLAIITQDTKIKNPITYTVKEVKGLEFKEIFVFSRNMTNSEKYIAYTRALAKLNIIDLLPESSNNKAVEAFISNEGQDSLAESANVAKVSKNSLKTAIKVRVVGAYAGEYYLIPYSGKLKNYTKEQTIPMFIPVTDSEKDKLVHVSVNTESHVVYIAKDIFKMYKEYFANLIEIKLINRIFDVN